MGRCVEVAALEWQPVRPDVARGVEGKTLLAGEVKIVLTRVMPGGGFSEHRDDYGHLFYFLDGKGVVHVGEEQFEARPGLSVQVAAGEPHAYRNTGVEEMILISVNVPDKSIGRVKKPEGV